MVKLIAIDDGHGIDTPGKRTPLLPNGKFILENQFNAPTSAYLSIALIRCGFRTMLTAPEEKDVILSTRVKRANDAKADALISVHYDAFRGVWDESKGGVSTRYQPGNVGGQKLAECIQKYVSTGTSQINRGAVAQNLQVTRGFKGPGALIECGFMDVHKEADLMLNTAFQKEQAEQIAHGVCEYFGVKYIPEKEEEVMSEAVKQILRACGQITQNLADGKPIESQVAWLNKNFEQYKKEGGK